MSQATRNCVKYHIIQNEDRIKTESSGTRCPKLTRYKLIGAITILTLTAIFITVSVKSFHIFPSSVCLNNKNSRKHLQHLPHTSRCLPQCLIIGARKAGTRALLTFLNIHPDIQVAGRELHFFDDDDNFSLGLEWYRKRMPYSYKSQITMEKTPSYFVESSVPERVYSMNTSIKLILIVKDPVERLISDYAQFRENKIIRGKKVISFESLVIDSDTGEINRSYNAIRRSIYCRHLQKWLRFFDLDQIKIVDGKKLIHAPWKEIRKVETFLGIRHVVTKEHFVYNTSRGFYCIKNDINAEKCLSPSKGRQHPIVQPWIIKKLRAFFHPFNEKFYRMTGRNFDWDDGYFGDDENER